MRAFDSATKGSEYVAPNLSSVSATDGKETTHRNGSLLVRQIRLEGLASATECSQGHLKHRDLLGIGCYGAPTKMGLGRGFERCPIWHGLRDRSFGGIDMESQRP
jgi:hypothetical protein